MKTCSFIGHANLQSKNNALKDSLRILLRIEIKRVLEENHVTTFLNGGRGDFDELCAEVVHELIYNKKYIKSLLVNPYKTKNLDVNQDHIKHLFTDSIIPKELKDSDVYTEIPKRNRLIVDKSDYIISFVINNSGGAFKALEYAKSQNHVEIINLPNELPYKFIREIKNKKALKFVGTTKGENNDPCEGFYYSATPLTKEKIEEIVKQNKYSIGRYVLPFFNSENKLEYKLSVNEIMDLISHINDQIVVSEQFISMSLDSYCNAEYKIKNLEKRIEIYLIIIAIWSIVLLFITIKLFCV